MAVATRWPFVGRHDELGAFASALADEGCEAFCIFGAPGVGKTRLAAECAARAAAGGRRVLRVTADRAPDAVPLGAVAHLLPTGSLAELGEGDVKDAVVRARLLHAALGLLAEQTATAGVPVLVVDDAHRLDASSLTIVDHLFALGAVFGVATIVTGELPPETVTRWWRDERAVRLELGVLDPLGVDTLLHVVLEGPLEASASAQFWDASNGNALALRELVLGALARGTLVRKDGLWQLNGPIGATTRMHELIRARIGALDDATRAALEPLALCQPVGLGQLEASFGLTTLEALERDGLISVHTDGRRESVRLAHPMHSEVLKEGIPALRSRSILIAQADAVQACGALRREDPIRVATWRLAATGRADPELLLRAARLARFAGDYRQAAGLARAAMASHPSAAAGLVLGESLYDASSFEEAEGVLADAAGRAASDDELVRISTVRRRNLFWGCRRDAEAIAAGRAVPRLAAAAARNELVAGEAEVLAFAGHPGDALRLLDQIDASVPRVNVLAAISRAAALATIGFTAQAVATSQRGFHEHIALGDELAIAPAGTHIVNQTWALVEAGRLAEADELGRVWLDRATRERRPLGVAWFGIHLARCALTRGRPAAARRLAERACFAAEAGGYDGLRPIASSLLAIAHALLGDAAASAARAGQIDTGARGFGFFDAELALGRAWALVAAGEVTAAQAALITAGAASEQAGHVPVAAWLLHDAMRLGAGEDTATRLAALAARSDSVLVAARANHAAALVEDDADRLSDAADRFEAIGAILLAAEAAAAAADSSRRRLDQRRATALELRSGQLAARCEGATTPGLRKAVWLVPLTAREREVAVLAAAGHPSRVIAERLYLSVRTVDNHLRRIYEKLGIPGRAKLADALEADQP
jgi:DNA-binding CsgD family transcriptional regulator